ncbi:coiled-coil and C2 domain-containing protein 2A-like isoform X2 [Ornithodoros turicata]|uniref:coiled-coil and C2 domain-containing protein 2A-like isoform X2 n=1 Tax=Ornithodoros turicata TaxID=34597 RepID=UPI0031388819
MESKRLLYDKVRQQTRRRLRKQSEASESFAQYENEAFGGDEDFQLGEYSPAVSTGDLARARIRSRCLHRKHTENLGEENLSSYLPQKILGQQGSGGHSLHVSSARQNQEAELKIAVEEAYNFFAKVRFPAVSVEHIVEPVGEEGASREGDELLTLDHSLQADTVLCQTVKPVVHIHDSQSYHIPSTKKVPHHAKVPGSEQEPSRTRKPRHVNKMENRLVNQSELHWFDRYGNIHNGAYPAAFDDTSSCPHGHQDNTRDLHVSYMKASSSIAYSYDLDERYRIDIDISSVMFHHHPLFSKEHLLTSQLLMLYRKYSETSSLQEEIVNLKRELLKVQEDNLRKEMLLRLLDLQQRESERNDLVDKLIVLWNEVCQLRQDEGYSATTIKLRYLKDHINDHVLRKDFDDAVEEEFELQNILYSQENTVTCQEQRQPPKESLDDAGPNRPSKVDEKSVANEAFAQLKRTSARVVLMTEDVTPFNQCPKNEQHRRQDVSNTVLHMSILCNGKEACKTEHKALGQDFTVEWKQTYSLLVMEYPQTITVELYETSGHRRRKIADIPLSIPDVEQPSADLVGIEFASDCTVAPKHGSVGCGWQSGQQWMNGVIRCFVYWAGDSNREALAPKNRVAITRKHARTSCNLSPNMICNSSKEKSTVGGPLSLKASQFCNKEDVEGNIRFRLLQLRDRRVPEFGNFMAVPLLEKEYLVSLTAKILAKKDTKKILPVYSDQIEEHQARTVELMKEMREQIMQEVCTSQRTLEDVVMEEEVPTIGSLGFSLLRLLRGHRSLRPTRRERKKIDIGEGEVLVTILRATNVPTRCDTEEQSPAEIVTGVCPFVQVMFQRETAQTFVADGPHPTWNQELHLPFKFEGSACTDIIYLNLFDQVVVDLLEDDRERSTTVYQRLQHRWLGCLKVPFMTLYLNGKIEGTFQLDVPPVLLGYKHESKSVTCVSLFITIEPPLQLPDPIGPRCESDEPPDLLKRAQEFQEAFQTKYPNRFIKALAMDVNGKWVFIPRYLHPISPPEELLLEGPNMDVVARFVSLIPTLADSALFPGVCDIWSTCDQFLEVLVGDEEEHAVLLCNFFLHMGKDAYLLLGTGIPEGQTAYVLTREDELSVWNATTGKRYSVTDSSSPLQSVGCIISSDNVWVNVQKHDLPSRMTFNLKKAAHWTPLLKKKGSEFHTVQPNDLNYKATDLHFAEQLEQKIEYVLKESIMKWRKRFRTLWNRHASHILRKILQQLERTLVSNTTRSDFQSLSELSASYKISGFPLSMGFTTVDAVVETILSTGVHLTQENAVEFALAVNVHPYPCNVFAIWVYVAALTRRI